MQVAHIEGLIQLSQLGGQIGKHDEFDKLYPEVQVSHVPEVVQLWQLDEHIGVQSELIKL